MKIKQFLHLLVALAAVVYGLPAHASMFLPPIPGLAGPNGTPGKTWVEGTATETFLSDGFTTAAWFFQIQYPPSSNDLLAFQSVGADLTGLVLEKDDNSDGTTTSSFVNGVDIGTNSDGEYEVSWSSTVLPSFVAFKFAGKWYSVFEVDGSDVVFDSGVYSETINFGVLPSSVHGNIGSMSHTTAAFSSNVIPEPSTLIIWSIFGLGIAAVGTRRGRK